MSDFTPDIKAFCCHYTSQQTCAEGTEGLKQDGFPESVSLFRVPCTGKIQVSTLLQVLSPPILLGRIPPLYTPGPDPG